MNLFVYKLEVTIDCQVNGGNCNANSCLVMTALYSAVLLENPLVGQKEYKISALFGEMNTIPIPTTLSYGSSYLLLLGS